MLLDDLPAACRKTGLVVFEYGGWRGHNHGGMSRVAGIVCHHTGSSGSGAERVVRDGRSDLRGPLAQLTLRRDGSVCVISNGVAWHAGTGSWPSIGSNNGNDRCIGIEAIYNGSDITADQLRAYPRLVASLCMHYKVPVGNVIGHKEWAPRRKVDPGRIDMGQFRRDVQAIINGGSSAPPSSATPPPAPPSGDRPLLQNTGRYDANLAPWVEAYQRWANPRFSYAGLKVDGWFGAECERFTKIFQTRVGFTGRDVDGKVGPMTWAKADQHGFRR